MYRGAPIEAWAKSVREAALLRKIVWNAESLIGSALNPSARVEEIAAQVEALGKTSHHHHSWRQIGSSLLQLRSC
jgi:hypothetical protein